VTTDRIAHTPFFLPPPQHHHPRLGIPEHTMHLPHRHETRIPVSVSQLPVLELRHWLIETPFRPPQKSEKARLSRL
jgi:hypothetical protein